MTKERLHKYAYMCSLLKYQSYDTLLHCESNSAVHKDKQMKHYAITLAIIFFCTGLIHCAPKGKAPGKFISSQDKPKAVEQQITEKGIEENGKGESIDQELLAKMAVESKDSNVRRSAVKKLTSQALLAKIAAEDEDIKVRILAAGRLADFAKTDLDNKSKEKFSSSNFFNKVTTTTEKLELRINNISSSEDTTPICGNEYCEKIESHSTCPADCFPEDIKPADLPEGDKAVFFNFVYMGQKSGIYFVVKKDVHERLDSLPRTITYKKAEQVVTKKDFILPKINNDLQRKHLLPLVEKIKSLTPDVNKQARIAISLVQNIPYGFPTDDKSKINYRKKFPYGVIWEHTGICDEKSDLLHFLLKELGFATAALIYKKEYHRAVGIKCPDAYDAGNSGYCYVEVTTPKIITDNSPEYLGIGTLTDFKLIKISDGRQLDGVEEEFTDKIMYYDLILKAKAENGKMEEADYKIYRAILDKYGIK